MQTRDYDGFEDADIGEWTYGLPQVYRSPRCGKLTIGKFCSIASGVTIALLADHRQTDITTYPFADNEDWPEIEAFQHERSPMPSLKNVTIGNDVWIGDKATLLAGANVGDGAIVGACCVVAGKVRPYAIVRGNAIEEIRRRFDDEQVEKLLKMKWWDWEIEKIREHLKLITGQDVDKLYEAWREF